MIQETKSGKAGMLTVGDTNVIDSAGCLVKNYTVKCKMLRFVFVHWNYCAGWNILCDLSAGLSSHWLQARENLK